MPGLGRHLLGYKNTPVLAAMREAVVATSLFSPFPFHSVYSIEDHRKHVDWVRQMNPDVLVSVKVSTPGDVDMVAVGSYYAGAHVVHLDGSYGGTGAAYRALIDLGVDHLSFCFEYFDEDAFARGIGVSQLFGEPGYTTLERRWARPTSHRTKRTISRLRPTRRRKASTPTTRTEKG